MAADHTEGPLHTIRHPQRPTPPPIVAAATGDAPYAVKPPWSVLSLPRLLEAIRETARTAPRRAAERLERGRQQRAESRDRRTAAAEQAWNDRYRNAWEHS